MKYDQYGRAYTSTGELLELLHQHPDLDMSKLVVTDPDIYNQSVRDFYAPFPLLERYESSNMPIEDFDHQMQMRWHMSEEYRQFDIAQWLLDQCDTQAKLQRVGQELLLYQERDLFDLLRYLKYMVDTFRKNNIVWGLGRGSSVASYVLYLIGVHKIDSIYYDLDIEEFLR